ncbi:MAG: SpoIIE family protein phosphatase [Deltaproteobacteria bacterium]|nr:SpoIIE family protein phosphatase [Deltaproteobacteria bacterium]
MSPQETGSNEKFLAVLLEIGQSIHTILNLDKLLLLVVERVKELLGCESVAIMLLDESAQEFFFRVALDDRERITDRLHETRFPATRGIAGRVLRTGQPVLVPDVGLDPDFYREVDRDTGQVTKSVIYAPLKVRQRIIGVMSGINKRGGNFESSDLERLTVIAQTISLSLENARANELLASAYSELKDSERLKQEIESARKMQQATLPEEVPHLPGWSFWAICRPATEIGGDYYDFFPLDDGRCAFTLGDVSGHGLKAGMMVSMARSCLCTQLNFSTEISEVMGAMNRMVLRGVKDLMLMTFFFGILDRSAGKMTFANAGHPWPFHYSAASKTWSFIEQGEFPLGVMEDYDYSIHSMNLHPGDTLVFYSDGIVEADNPHKKLYGHRRLKEVLSRVQDLDVKTIGRDILDDLDNYRAEQPFRDDVTLVIVQVADKPA